MIKKHKFMVYMILLLMVIIAILSGCQGSDPTPEPEEEGTKTPLVGLTVTKSTAITEIAAASPPDITLKKEPDKTEVNYNEKVVITVSTSGKSLKFDWKVTRGILSTTDRQSTIYTAPNEPGPDTVDVIVTSDGWSRTETVIFTVIAEPTETPSIPIVTPTFTPTSPSSPSSPSPTTLPETTENPVSTPTRTLTPTNTRLPTVEETITQFRQQGYFVVCTSEHVPPYESRNENGELHGFDIDLIREFAHRWLEIDRESVVFKEIVMEDLNSNERQNLVSVKQEKARELLAESKGVLLIVTSTPDRIPCLEGYWGDLLASAFGYTTERCSRVACSQTYAQDGPRLLVPTDSNITGICDPDLQSISIVRSTTAEDHLKQAEERLCDYEQPPTINEYNTEPEAIDVVKTGLVDAYVTDGIILQQFADTDPDLEVRGDEFGKEDLRLAVPLGHQPLELINWTLQEIKDDGTYDVLHEKWFGCRRPALPILIDSNITRPDFVKSNNPLQGGCEEVEVSQYTIQQDDTLLGIAGRLYGNIGFSPCIQEANGISDDELRRLSIGRVLNIPPIEQCIE